MHFPGFKEEEEGKEHVEDPLAASTFRRSQKKIAIQIEKLEQESVAKKHWTLLGEAGSKQRSPNSLLENFVEYDSNAKVSGYPFIS